MKILLVDKECESRDAIAAVLEASGGHTVLVASTVAGAYRLMSLCQGLDVVVSNVNLERNDRGEEVVGHAKKMIPNVRCAMMSSGSILSLTPEMEKAGVEVFFLKPHFIETFQKMGILPEQTKESV